MTDHPTAPVQDDDAERLMREFYLSASKAKRPADNVKAAIAFALSSRLSPTHLDTDTLIVKMLHELHAHLPEDQRPMSMSDLSDEQAERARKVVNAVVVAACLSKPAGHHASIAELEATISTPETGLVGALTYVRDQILVQLRSDATNPQHGRIVDPLHALLVERAFEKLDTALSNVFTG